MGSKDETIFKMQSVRTSIMKRTMSDIDVIANKNWSAVGWVSTSSIYSRIEWNRVDLNRIESMIFLSFLFLALISLVRFDCFSIWAFFFQKKCFHLLILISNWLELASNEFYTSKEHFCCSTKLFSGSAIDLKNNGNGIECKWVQLADKIVPRTGIRRHAYK